MEIRYQVFFSRIDENGNGISGSADLAFDDLVPFFRGKTIHHLRSYVVGNDPHSRPNVKDPDLDYDKSIHRCR